MKAITALHLRPLLFRGLSAAGAVAFTSALALAPLALLAQGPAKNPTGKVYVAGVEGGAQAATGDKIEMLAVKSIFQAQGAQIETKPRGTLTMVFSNGTGFFLDQDTHIDVTRFTQESFTASRTDLELEPSISHTDIFLPHGTVAVSTSKLAAGSTLTITTPLGSFNLHGGNLVIEAEATSVKFSLLLGEGTVNGGSLDLGGQVLHAGEQAVIHPGAPGQPNIVVVGKIPPGELPRLEAMVAQAYAARKTVFFSTDASDDITVFPVVPTSLPVQSAISPSRLPR